jgi:hypothetical protein
MNVAAGLYRGMEGLGYHIMNTVKSIQRIFLFLKNKNK